MKLAFGLSLTHDTSWWWAPSVVMAAVGGGFLVLGLVAAAIAAWSLAGGALVVARNLRLRAVATHSMLV
ncbi:MAG: hypothetical protein KF773_29195 [Deltaproteobacteria bacterium]|nr:hypothetical protein [Deltaproteobacteria bacterium]